MDSKENHVVIITGAASGIGEETSYAFAKKGSSLSLVDMNGEGLKNVEEEMKKIGVASDKFLSITCDLSEQSSFESIISQTVDRFGRIDVLVNNAGFAMFTPFKDLTVDELDRCYNVLLKAPLFLSQKALPHLIKTKGCIVNISSVLSKIGVPENTAYCVMKSGIRSLTKNLALEGAPHGVRVNSIHPGSINTPILRTAGLPEKELYEYGAKITPLGRVGTSSDVASAILYLASDAASFITGASLYVDGGMTLASPANAISGINFD